MATHHESTRTTFETPWGKLRNLYGMKLTTDVTLLFLLAVDNGIFVYFLCQVWTMNLNESIDISYVSVRVSRTFKVNIKETFMGNDSFLQLFIWWMHSSQRIRRITWDI